MKKRKKKKILKFLIIFILLSILFNLGNIYFNYKDNYLKNSKYKIVKKDILKQYPGIGQQKIQNKNGYFTTFTTTNKKTYIEYKQNLGTWKDLTYWDGSMNDNGCGITAISIILSGYGYNITPEHLRNTYFPHLNSNEIPNVLKEYNILSSGFYYDTIHLSKEKIQNHLLQNLPILICLWNKPNQNRWTSTSHYMVLLATYEDLVYVSNPNGLDNNYNSSGWYEYDEIIPYIAKILFIDN